MTQAIRRASYAAGNVFVAAALVYKELAVSASDLLKPQTYRRSL